MNIIMSSSLMRQHAGGTMEYDDDGGVAESVPEFGAIFMTSALTKKECFRHKIFALPHTQAEFVKKIKAGIVLFLFEFKKRQLFGVYQASSDGAMNIVPHAFSNSGKRYPAQVRFTTIWYCEPLSEKEFKNAIIENYYSAKKFKWGLSEEQVGKLMFLFSSRKMRNDTVPRPVSKDRRSAGGDIFGLSERGYRESTENNEFNPAAFSDHHTNSFVEEDEVLLDDRVQGDFLAKRRRIDNDARLLENDMDELYNYGSIQNFQNDSPMDSLDEVSNLTAVRHFLAVEKARKQNKMNKLRNAVLSSESMMDPLDIRTDYNDRFTQRNSSLFDEYIMEKDLRSEHYEKPLGTRNHAIDDDRLMRDDCVQRNQNIRDVVKPTVYGDGNLSFRRQAMQQVKEDHQCSMNRKMENRCHLDHNVSPLSAFEHNTSLLHETREISSGRRFPFNNRMDSEPNFVPCDEEDHFVPCDEEDRSSAIFSRRGGHIITHDREYPIVERRVTGDLADGTFCSATSTRNGEYFERVGGRVVDEKRFQTHTGPGISFGCPSSTDKLLPEKGFSQLNSSRNYEPSRATFDDATITRATPYIPELPNFSHGEYFERVGGRLVDEKRFQTHTGPGISFGCPSSTDKLLPEKGFSQLNSSRNYEPSRATFDDATITRATPYIPELPNFSHGFNASMIEAKQISSTVRENPHRVSQEDLYSSYKNRSLPEYALESKKSSRSVDIAPEFGNKGLPTNVSGSFLNPGLSTHADSNTSVHVNGRCSLFSKPFLARSETDHEKIGGERGLLFAYPPKSSGKRFDFDENPTTASQHTSKHVLPRQEMDMLTGKDFISSEAKEPSLGNCHSEIDITRYENQQFGISSNLNCQANHVAPEAPPQFDPNVNNRKSVFSRLTSREEIRGGGEDRNESGFDSPDCFMDATAGQVMDMIRQSNNSLSPKKLKKSKIVGQPKHGETSPGEKQVRSHVEIFCSAMEKKRLKDDEHLIPIEATIDEVPKETRVTDFKRRSDTKKNVVGTANQITGANEEAGNPMKTTTVKRKKLVRPVFRKTESGTDTICSNQNSRRVPGQIVENVDKPNCEKVVSICDSKMHDDSAKISDVLVSPTHQSKDCEHSSPVEQKDVKVQVLPSPSNELKGHKSSILGLTEVHKPSVGTNIKEQSSPEEQKDIAVDVLPSSSIEFTKEQKTPIVGLHFDNPQALIEVHKPSIDCNNIKEPLSPDDQKDISVDVLSSLSTEHAKEHTSSTADLHIDNRSQVLLTELQNQSMDCNNIKEPSCPEEQKDIKVHVLSSSSTELTKEHKSTNVGLHVDDSSQAFLSELQKPSMDCNNDLLVYVLPSSSTELIKEHKTSIAGLHIDNSSQALPTEFQKPSMDCNNLKEHSDPKEQKDIKVHVLPSSINGLKQHKRSIVGLHIDKSSQAPITDITPHKVTDVQTSAVDFLSKNVDSTPSSSLNLEESSSSVGLEFVSGSLNNPVVEKGPTRMVKRKIIRKVVKKIVKKVNKTGTEPLLNESERVS